MWNQKLKELLHRFLDSKDPTEVEQFFSEQTQQFDDPDATRALSNLFLHESEKSISFNTLRSMHFEISQIQKRPPSYLKRNGIVQWVNLVKEEWQPFGK